MSPALICCLYLAALGVLSHFIGQALPRRWFLFDRFPYRLYDFERNGALYDKLHIRAWKDRVPDMSRVLPGMVKKQVTPNGTAGETRAVLLETCVAEFVHFALILCSCPILFLWRSPLSVLLYLLYNLLGNVSFILIQRYNRPRLQLLYARRLQREAAR